MPVDIDPNDTIPDNPIDTNAIDPLVLTANFSFTIEYLKVSFMNNSKKRIANWRYFGDGSGVNYDETPEYTYSRPGSYSVQLVVIGAGNRRDTMTQELRVEREEKEISTNYIIDSPYKNFDNWYKG